MSHWDAQQPPPDSPAPPKRRRLLPIMLAGACVLGVLVGLGVLIGQVASWSRPSQPAPPENASGPSPESLRKKYAAVADAFNGGLADVRGRRLRSMRRLMDAVVAAAGEENQAALLKLVNLPRMLEEMSASGAAPPLRFYQYPSARAWVKRQLSVPARLKRYALARVDYGPDPKEAVVYGFFWGPGGEEQKLCWWVRRDEQGWKAYDWELLDYGLRASAEQAIFYAHRDSLALRRYLGYRRDAAAADGVTSRADQPAAIARLTTAEADEVPAALRNDLLLLVGNAWLGCGRARDALACFRRVQPMEAHPGAIRGQAAAYSRLHRYHKALELADRYVQLLGRSPAADQLMGHALLAMGRPDEAAGHLRRALEIDAESLDCLRSLGLALDDGDKAVLVDYVKKTARPAATAQSLAGQFTYYGSQDSAALEAMRRLLTALEPDSPAGRYLAGMALEMEGDYLGAARLHRQAADRAEDVEARQRYLDAYHGAMLSAGRPVQGYEDSPDADAALAYFGDAYTSRDYEFPREQFLRLLTVHGLHHFRDPRLHYYLGLLMEEDRQYQAAAEEFAEGMRLADSEEEKDLLASLRSEHRSALCLAGRVLEAYEEGQDPDETFRQLAQQLSWGREPEKLARLEELIERHRAHSPNDPWLDYYQGTLLEQRKQYAEADQFFARGLSQARDSSIRSRYSSARLAARLASGEVLSALDDVPPADETFAFLAQRLTADGQSAQLQSLVERYRQRDPSSPALLFWEVEMLWDRGDYAAIVKRLSPWPVIAEGKLTDWQVASLESRFLRACLRSGQLAPAAAMAKRLYEESGDPLPLVLVRSREGKVAETARLMGELFPAEHGLQSAYRDEDAGPLLKGPEFLAVRRQYPPALPLAMTTDFIVLLLDRPRRLEEKSLRRTCADALGPEATLAAVPQEPSPRRPGASAGWIVRLPGERGTLCITAEAGRYKSADGDFRTPRFSQAALDQAMAEHRAWLCVAVCAENGDGAGRLFHAACRLAAGLVDDHALAVYVPEVGRLAPADAAAREGLLADEPKKMLCSLGEPAVLYRDAPDETPPGADRERRARLKALASALAGPGPVKEPVVRVELWMGSLSESVRVALDRRVRFGGDDHLFRGRVLDQSRLFPELRPGEPVSVLPDEIVAWEQTHGE